MDSHSGNGRSNGVVDKGEELENGISVADGVHDHTGGHGRGSFIKKVVWHGGSVYDAWLNAVSAQVWSILQLDHFPLSSYCLLRHADLSKAQISRNIQGGCTRCRH